MTLVRVCSRAGKSIGSENGCRRTDRGRIPRAVLSFNARVAREVDAGSCDQSGVRQSVAGIVVGEKNRCIQITAPGAGSVAVRRHCSGLAGTISGTIEGTVVGRLSHDLVYT